MPDYIVFRCDHTHRFRTCIVEASHLGDGVWYLNRLLVAYELRGHGIGTQLLARVRDRLKELEAKKLIVEPGGYGSDPEKLDRFYRARGFVADGAALALVF